MNEKDLNTWKRLYEAADLLKTQKPWELLDYYDFVTVERKDGKSSAYCTVLGDLLKSHTISVYETEDALYDIIYELDNEDIPWHQATRYNNCLNVIFGDRDLLLPSDREMIDLVGQKYRGRKAWTLFRSLEKGRMDKMLNVEEAVRLTDVILQLSEAFADIRARELVLSEENDETILRRYDRKTKKWETLVAPLNDKPKSLISFSVTDEILMKQLKRRKKLETVMEIDVMHHIISTAIGENGGSLLERFAMCCEAGNPSDPYLIEVLDPEDEEVPMILNILVGYIEEFGRPGEIRLRDDMIEISIKEICEELGIRTSVSGSLPAIDAVFESATGLDMLGKIDEE